MDDKTVEWVTKSFVAVDPRFGEEWAIPFERVQRALDRLDSYWDRHPGVPRTGGGLIQLCAPGAGDYQLAVRDVAVRIRNAAENTNPSKAASSSATKLTTNTVGASDLVG